MPMPPYAMLLANLANSFFTSPQILLKLNAETPSQHKSSPCQKDRRRKVIIQLTRSANRGSDSPIFDINSRKVEVLSLI